MGARSRTDWSAVAARAGERLPRERFHPRVLAWVGTRRKRAPWCIAFSGGADSLCLLLLLWAHWPERRRQLVGFHFNHRLRGAAARRDAEFCRRVCAALGIRFRSGEWTESRADASEAAARSARLDFFRKELARCRSSALWLAHHRDDVAESLLMRVARGSGTAGLAAPRPVQVWRERMVFLRPLLGIAKSELVAVLRESGACWQEDATNGDGRFFRNRMRQQVIPIWQEAAGRDAVAGASLARERLEEDDEALESWVDELDCVVRGKLRLDRLAGKPRAVWRRALHRWLLRAGPEHDLSRAGFDRLLGLAEAGRDARMSLGRGFAVVRAGVLGFRVN